MNLGASLKRKYGPLPAWAWLGLLAAVLVVFRYFRGGAGAASSSGASSTDTGAPASSDVGTGRGGGADAGGLTPSQQTLADPGLTGPGTAVVFDPLTGTTEPAPLTSPAPATVVPPTSRGPARATTTAGRPATSRATGPGIPRDPAAAWAQGARDFGLLPKQTKPKPAPRPKTARGQTGPPRVRAAPELVSEHGLGQMHPQSVAHEPSVAPTRTQQNAAPVVERPRSDTSVHVDAGARASSVAAPSLIAVHAAHGRDVVD